MWNNWHNFFIFAILHGIKFFCMLRWSYFANYHVCRRGHSFEWEKLTNGLFFTLFSKQNGNNWQKYRIIWVFRAWYLHNLMFSFNFAIEIVVECHWFADEIAEIIIFLNDENAMIYHPRQILSGYAGVLACYNTPACYYPTTM